MTKGSTILAACRQIDFPDQFRLLSGQLMTFLGQTETIAGLRFFVLCTDGKTRVVKPEEVREHEL